MYISSKRLRRPTFLQGAHAPYTGTPEDFAGHPIPRNPALDTLFEAVRSHPATCLSPIADTCCRAQWLSRVISWTLTSEEDLQVMQNDTTSVLETLSETYKALQQWSLVPQKVKFRLLLLALRADFA